MEERHPDMTFLWMVNPREGIATGSRDNLTVQQKHPVWESQLETGSPD